MVLLTCCHVNQSQEQWTFEQVITGLYDRFIHLTMMQEVWDTYYTACYNPQYGMQEFYDTLMDHAQNMSVYPDSYNLMDTFRHGLPASMHAEMLKNGLTPEANTVEDFIAEGKAIEEATKMQEHYK